MVKEHLNACADCNAIYQKLLSHTSEDVLHEESESVIMRHEAKEKQRGRKKITIAVLVSIALCIIAIFTALFLLPINIAYEPVKIDFPFGLKMSKTLKCTTMTECLISRKESSCC